MRNEQENDVKRGDSEAIGSSDDGRLIMSTTPPIVGVGTWR